MANLIDSQLFSSRRRAKKSDGRRTFPPHLQIHNRRGPPNAERDLVSRLILSPNFVRGADRRLAAVLSGSYCPQTDGPLDSLPSKPSRDELQPRPPASDPGTEL